MSWCATRVELIKKEIESLLSPLINLAGFQELISESLAAASPAPGKESLQSKPWSLLPVAVCESISGDYEKAIPVAAALQLLRAAAEVFDDIEDADSPNSIPARYGNAAATNAATTLLVLAEKAITRLKARGVADDVIVRIMDGINTYYTVTCTGQHLDLSMTQLKEVSEEMYLKAAEMKSASTFECACHAGALLSTCNQELINRAADFGHNLGMVGQIANDIRGITGGRDIKQRKMTLPAIFALRQADDRARQQLEKVFLTKADFTGNPDEVRELLFSSGAVHYTLIKMGTYQQRARENLIEMERLGASTDRLKQFIE